MTNRVCEEKGILLIIYGAAEKVALYGFELRVYKRMCVCVTSHACVPAIKKRLRCT